jgi:PKD repeat protein
MFWRIIFISFFSLNLKAQKPNDVLRDEFYLLIDRGQDFDGFNLDFHKNNSEILSLRFAFPEVDDEYLKRVLRVKLDSNLSFDEQADFLRNLPFVEFYEPVPLLEMLDIPNDLGASFGENSQWNLHITSAPQAWELTQGSEHIFVAVVDDGVLITHEDLENNVWINSLEIPNNGIDDDGNGYIDDYWGYDVALDSSMVYAINMGHGTFTTGLASATTNNGIGIAAMGYSTKFLAVKSTSLPQVVTHAYEGVVYAVRRKSPIINMSWGGSRFSKVGEEVIRYAYNKGSILIAAAGNSGQAGNPLIYPAAYNFTIAVAASDSLDRKAGFSSYGNFVDITAPGERVISTTIGNEYQSSSGTSFAAPLVAGVAALMLSLDSTLTQSQILSCLQQSADNFYDLNPDFIDQLGAGRVNAYKACECAQSISTQKPIAEIIVNKSIICKNESVLLTALNLGGNAQQALWFIPEISSNLFSGFEVEVVFPENGEYDITLVLEAFQGNDTLSIQNLINVQEGALFESHRFDFTEFTNFSETNFSSNTDRWQLIKLPSFFEEDSTFLVFSNHQLSSGTFELVSPIISLSDVNQPQLTFDYAYAFNPNKTTDTLKIYAQTLGENVAKYFLMSIPGSDVDIRSLSRFHQDGIPFFPKPSEWCYHCFEIPLNGLSGVSELQIIFEVVSAGTQNLFIDNISIESLCESPQIIEPENQFNYQLPEFATVFCQEQTIQFIHNDPNSTGIFWEFQGGEPSFSMERNPKVVYKNTGVFDVKLRVINHLYEEEKLYDSFVEVFPKPQVFIRASAGGICIEDSLILNAFGGKVYDWGILKNDSIGQLILFPEQDAYAVVIGSDERGCTAFADIFIPYFEVENPQPIINFENNWIAPDNKSYSQFLWYFNSEETDNISNKIFAQNDGLYQLKVWNELNCVKFSNELNVERSLDFSYIVYPNPAQDFIVIYNENGFENETLSIVDLNGRILQSIQAQSQNFVMFQIGNIQSGVYLIQSDKNKALKFLKK